MKLEFSDVVRCICGGDSGFLERRKSPHLKAAVAQLRFVQSMPNAIATTLPQLAIARAQVPGRAPTLLTMEKLDRLEPEEEQAMFHLNIGSAKQGTNLDEIQFSSAVAIGG